MLKSWKSKDLWGAYRLAVYGEKNVPPDQERECRNAFFAGLHSAFEWQLQMSDLPEEEAMKAISQFHDELKITAKAMNPTGEN